MNIDTGVPGPAHKMAEENVAVPTIVSREIDFQGRKISSVWIQWFGASDSKPNHIPEGAQFFFDTEHDENHCMWMKDIGSFQVVFIGQIKDWPKTEAIDRLIEITKGSFSTTIVWMMSPVITPTGRPASPMIKISVLGDPICDIIEPKFYCDLTIIEKVMKAISQKRDLLERLIQNPEEALPPEEIPWTDKWEKCNTCEPLSKSYSEKPGVPKGGHINDFSHTCKDCGRRWWQSNDHYHLWQHVKNPIEWESIRRQQILKDAGLSYPEN